MGAHGVPRRHRNGLRLFERRSERVKRACNREANDFRESSNTIFIYFRRKKSGEGRFEKPDRYQGPRDLETSRQARKQEGERAGGVEGGRETLREQRETENWIKKKKKSKSRRP